MCPIVRTQFFVLSFFDIIIISFCRISVYILRHFFDILDKNADKTKKYKDLYILHDNSRQNLTVHLPSFSSDFHMQLSKIITANIAVKWGQGSNLPVIRPDFFVTPTDYLFADFYNTQNFNPRSREGSDIFGSRFFDLESRKRLGSRHPHAVQTAYSTYAPSPSVACACVRLWCCVRCVPACACVCVSVWRCVAWLLLPCAYAYTSPSSLSSV